MCECGHDQEHHVTMRDHVGPCMRCNCSHFEVESDDTGALDQMNDVTADDLKRMRQELLKAAAELS